MKNRESASTHARPLRGGRLTKFKGKAASIAPGLAVAVAGLMLTGGAAQANNECGTDASGQDTVTCAAGTYETGITYRGSDGLTLELDDASITMEGGVWVSGSGDISVTAKSFATITRIGDQGFAHGILAYSQGLGTAEVKLEDGTVTTTGDDSRGIFAYIDNVANSATATAWLTGGDIETTGVKSYGVYAYTIGSGAATAQMEGGTVTTEGESAYGLYALINNTASTATATALLTGGDIETDGDNAYGLRAYTTGSGDATARMDGGSVTTGGGTPDGYAAYGLYAQINNTASTATATAWLTEGDVFTSGDDAYGLYAYTTGSGDATARMDGGSVTTEGGTPDGYAAYGLYAQINNTASTATATAWLTEGDGKIDTTGGYAAGLYAYTTGRGAATAQMEGGTVTTEGLAAHGLYAEIDNADSDATATALLTVGDDSDGDGITDAGEINTAGEHAYGLFAFTNGSGAATAQMDGGEITTAGFVAHGLYAQISNTASTATATALLTGGDIETAGNYGYGLRAYTNGDGDALAQMDGGTVRTEGDNAYGLFADAIGLGDATARMDGGTVTTEEQVAYGLYAQINNTASTATATARLTVGDVFTSGDDAHGLFAVTTGSGEALAQMDGGSVTTVGDNAYGLYALIINTASTATATALLTGGDIETDGDNAYGLRAYTTGSGDATARMDGGSVTTGGGTPDGYAAYGLYALTSGSGDALAQMDGGSVTTGDETDATLGVNAHGLYALANWSGDATAQMEGGTVTTFGDDASGLYAWVNNTGSAATATALLTEGDDSDGITDAGVITTSGDNAYGLYAENDGSGEALAQMDGGSVTTGDETDATLGEDAHGLYAVANWSGDATAQMEGGTVTTFGDDSSGLYAWVSNIGSIATAKAWLTAGNDSDGDGITDAGVITTSGDNAYGVYAENDGSGEALAQMDGGSVTTGDETDATLGVNAHGLYALANWSGDATAQMEGGTVTTGGDAASGLYAWVSNTGSIATAKAWLTEGKDSDGDGITDAGVITTSGDNAYGVYARTDGSGEALAQMDGGSVTTGSSTDAGLGRNAYGLYALATGDTSDATAKAWLTGDDGDINTSGYVAHGVYARTDGLGDATAQMDGGTVTTSGESAYGLATLITETDSTATAKTWLTGGEIDTVGYNARGLYARTDGSGEALVQMDGGTVTTDGGIAHGLYALSTGTATVIQGAGADVTVSGEDADGIRADGATGFDVDVAGSVTGGSGTGAGIRTISATGQSGTIDIANTATVGAASGIAVQDGDGDTTITTSGNITGDVILGLGNDTFNWSAGTLAGAFYGGDGADTATISATAYDGSHVLDGGDDSSVDTLTLSGLEITFDAGSIMNWEDVILDGTVLSIGGTATIDSSVTNDGVLTSQDGVAGDVITIAGNYTGSGVIMLDTVLGGDGSASDMLVITGDTSGETAVSIANIGGGGDVTSLEIDVVTVGGDSNGTFVLINGNYETSDGEQAVIAGAYLYTLVEADDGSGWLLQAGSSSAPDYHAGTPIYDSYAQSLLALTGISSLRQRGSAQDYRQRASGAGTAAVTQSDTSGQNTGSPLWIQMGTEHITTAGDLSATGAARDSNIWALEAGADRILTEGGAGFLVGGVMLTYANSSTSVTSDFGDGSIETTGLGLGLAGTWYDYSGFYVDGQVKYSSYESDLTSASLGALTSGNGGTGFALSMEAGKEYQLNPGLTVIPQAQLSLSSVAFESFTGPKYSETVALTDADSTQLRLGLEVDHYKARADGDRRLYGIANLFHEFGAGSAVDVSEASVANAGDAWRAGVGVGGSLRWKDDHSIYGEATYATGLGAIGESNTLSTSFGFKMVL